MGTIVENQTIYGKQALDYLDEKPHNGYDVRSLMVAGINCPDDLTVAKQMFQSTWDANNVVRKGQLQVYTVIQSFKRKDQNHPDGELDPDNPDDVQKCNDLGRDLANEMVKQIGGHHQAVVSTQYDGEGHCLHNHIVICNQDYINGKCIRGAMTRPWNVQDLNDQIMDSYGMKQPEAIGLTKYEKKLMQSGEYCWKQDLKDRLDGVMGTMPSNWSELIQRAHDKDIEIIPFAKRAYQDHDPSTMTVIDPTARRKRISYRFTDNDGKKRKITSKRLGDEYAFDNMDYLLNYWNDINNGKDDVQDENRPSQTISSTEERTEQINRDIESILSESKRIARSTDAEDGRSVGESNQDNNGNESGIDFDQTTDQPIKPVTHRRKRKRKQRDDGLDL